jgi:hypothetical protein
LARHRKRQVLFDHTGAAHRATIDPAVAWIDHHDELRIRLAFSDAAQRRSRPGCRRQDGGRPFDGRRLEFDLKARWTARRGRHHSGTLHAHWPRGIDHHSRSARGDQAVAEPSDETGARGAGRGRQAKLDLRAVNDHPIRLREHENLRCDRTGCMQLKDGPWAFNAQLSGEDGCLLVRRRSR